MNCLTKLFQQKRRRIGYILAFSGPMISKRDSSDRYKKDKEQYGKKAASWMMLYSFLSIVAIYLICVVIAYIIVGIVAVLIFALIVSLAFPTRYYVVRRW